MVVVLENPIRSYDWGSPTVLPELLGVRPTGRPQAELWAGAHPGSPSLLAGGGPGLDAHVAADPTAYLGAATTARFGSRLPFLLKILAVERPLSIQVHPTIAQAESGYAAEDAAGVALGSPHRSYRDRQHKPEMVVAVTPFDALLGFAEPTAAAAVVDRFDLPGLVPILSALRAERPRDAAEYVLGLSHDEAATLAGQVTGVAAAHTTEAHTSPFDLIARLAVDYPADRGILFALLMDHVRLDPGEAVFVPAGVPHAYLHGVAVEPQASSDNTLRAGLTPKHVDLEEVARLLRYEPGGAIRVSPQPTGGPAHEAVYAVPADEFALTRWELTEEAVVPIGPERPAPWVVLVLAGQVEVASGSDVVSVGPGAAAFVSAEDAADGTSMRGTGVVFGVTTGL